MRQILGKRTNLAALIGVSMIWIASLDARAVTYFVNGASGTDRSQCLTAPGTGAAACKTIMYIVNNRVLTGGDVVSIAPGIYRESLQLTPNDMGTSESNRLVFEGAGPGQTFIYGLDPRPLDDASGQPCSAALNCAGDGLAYPLVYRFDVTGRTVYDVFETVWPADNILVNDGPSTGVQYHHTKPVPYTSLGSVPAVQGVSGSYFRNGNFLYVHTWNDVAPNATSNDVETSNTQRALYLNGRSGSQINYVTFRKMTFAYSQWVAYVTYTDHLALEDVEIHSGRDHALVLYQDCDYSRLQRVTIRSVQTRGDYSTPCDKNCGWVDRGGGTIVTLTDPVSPPSVGHYWEDVTVLDGWNLITLSAVQNSTFRRMMAMNAPNHTLSIMGDGSTCSGTVIESGIFLNGQDGVYNSGCANLKILRNNADYSSTYQTGAASGVVHHSNLATNEWPVGVCEECKPGWRSDHNWYPAANTNCMWGAAHAQCGTQWASACNCDANRVAGTSVPLAGTTWPVSNGLALSRMRRSDFFPTAASTALIDRGNPDLDGDGVLETGPGGDDECTVANDCYGAGPDIGAFEFGIDTPGGGTGDPLAAPENVRRADQRAR